MFYSLISIFIGGGTGAICRFLASKLSSMLFFTPLYGTFAVNISGCFLIGLFFGFLSAKTATLSPEIKLFLSTGFLGGLTTFSTFNYEVFELIKTGKIFSGLIYLLVSCISGLIFTYAGYCIFAEN